MFVVQINPLKYLFLFVKTKHAMIANSEASGGSCSGFSYFLIKLIKLFINEIFPIRKSIFYLSLCVRNGSATLIGNIRFRIQIKIG